MELEATPGSDALELLVQFVFVEIAECSTFATNEVMVILAAVQFIHDARIAQ